VSKVSVAILRRNKVVPRVNLVLAVSQGGGFFVGKIQKIIIIKIGSGVLLTKHHKVDQFRIKHIANQISALRSDGYQVVLIVSGAVAYGSRFIDVSEHNSHRKLAASIGQIYIITALNEIFGRANMQISQLLLTKEDLVKRQKDIKELIEFSLVNNLIPVINENDVLDLNSFGGNDLLAVEIAKQLKTEKVIILSTLQGSTYGVGGAKTKIEAKKHLENRNILMHILDGKQKNVLLTI